MILAAGFGTRLRPLTYHIPKPLFPVLNIPLIKRILYGLKTAGFKRIVINAYHLADILIKTISRWDIDQEITFVKEPFLLGTGGAVKNALPYFKNDPVLLINSDVSTDIDPKAVYEAHCRRSPVATMVLHDCPRFNSIKIIDGRVRGFGFNGPGALAFTGISVIEPELIRSISDHFPNSLIDALSGAITTGKEVLGIMADRLKPGYRWDDIGSVKGYLAAHEAILKQRGETIFAGAGSKLRSDSSIDGWCVLGDGVEIGSNVTISRSVIWNGCSIKDGETIKDLIVTPYGRLGISQP
ncbi:MAG: sugar phosphate nucleotidyltransferase [Dissulfurimicrobium sp.]|uniref:sugar phosphate nucleotidyltransferase n=1 Tax=Dissulfurimicrobium sp. TaxID=2022436 RepID=UPI00404B1D3E